MLLVAVNVVLSFHTFIVGNQPSTHGRHSRLGAKFRDVTEWHIKSSEQEKSAWILLGCRQYQAFVVLWLIMGLNYQFVVLI